MAERRMFAKMIIDSDAFLSMPMSTQALYFHLAMRADDDGFVNGPKKIARMVGAAEDDMKILIGKRYILAFASGVIVIKHWRIHNYIQCDRYKPTLYQEEKLTLVVKGNKSYTEASRLSAPAIEPEHVDNTDDIQNGYNMDTQVSLGKVRLEQGKESMEGADAPPPSGKKKVTRNKYGEYGWVRLSDLEHANLTTALGEDELARCIKYVDESAQKTKNKNEWKDWNLVIRNCHRDKWGSRNWAGKSTEPQAPKEYIDTDGRW